MASPDWDLYLEASDGPCGAVYLTRSKDQTQNRRLIIGGKLLFWSFSQPFDPLSGKIVFNHGIHVGPKGLSVVLGSFTLFP